MRFLDVGHDDDMLATHSLHTQVEDRALCARTELVLYVAAKAVGKRPTMLNILLVSPSAPATMTAQALPCGCMPL